MAYYGYERLRPGDALGIDMSEITKKVGTDLRAYEKKKGEDKESVAKSNRDFAELMATMPSSYNAEHNAFFGKASNDYSKNAAQVQSDFANRRIDKVTHDIQMANLNSGGKMMVDSLTGYATLINDLEEKKEAGLLSQKDLFRLSELQSYADLANVTLVIDPESKQPSFVKINKDGKPEAMLVNQFFNDVNVKMEGPTDTAAIVSDTLKLAGIQDITLKDGSQKIYQFTGGEADAALDNAANAGLAQINKMMAYATASVMVDEDGKTINFDYAKLPGGYLVGGILDEEKLKKLQAKNPGIFYEDLSGKYHVSDADRKIIIDNFKNDLKFASNYTEVQAKTTDSTDDNIKRILNLTLIAQRSGQRIDKDTLGILLANTKGNINFEALSSALEIIPDKPSAAELQKLYDAEKAKKEAIKIDFAIDYLKQNLFTTNGVFLTPNEGNKYTEESLLNLLTPLGLRIENDETLGVVVYNGNTPVISLGTEVTKEKLELLKNSLIAGSEDDIYALFRRSNPDYTYEGDVDVEEEEDEYPLD